MNKIDIVVLFLSLKQNHHIFYVICSAIRELATKALHNLTPQAPDYMATTGKQCHFPCSPVNVELSMKINCSWEIPFGN